MIERKIPPIPTEDIDRFLDPGDTNADTVDHNRSSGLSVDRVSAAISEADGPFAIIPGEALTEMAQDLVASNIQLEAPTKSALEHIKDPRIVDNLRVRHQIKHFLRTIFDSLGFIEVDTPILGSAVTEYAKDSFRVTGNAGEFYLPQSPQIYKQALVINALSRYFQFAKCFRDEKFEGQRTDQLHEFTQIDLELRCENETDLRELGEEVIWQLFSSFGKECVRPFPIIDYNECLKRYGTDKPDLRKDSTDNAFLWVVNFPQFITSDSGEIVTTHHPFQMPIIDDVSDIKGKTFEIGSSTFDLVLNGIEIGGGDMRINDYEVQSAVLEVLGLSQSQFTLVLDSLRDGQAPRHGGMAIGLDRITMAITDTLNIKDVNAFNV